MKCPVCKTAFLDTHPLDAELSSERCRQCGGDWISSRRYWSWLNLQPYDVSDASEPRTLAPDSPGLKICPECGHLMRRYEIGHGASFSLDRCGSCGGLWLDGGEYDQLRRQNLHRQLHLVSSAHWQRTVEAQRRADAHEQLARQNLGEDYAQAVQVRQWLLHHPKKDQLLAYISGQS